MSVIPTVLDQSSRGERAYDIYSLLLRERIVFLGQEVDDQIANLLVAEILYLGQHRPGQGHLPVHQLARAACPTPAWPSTTSMQHVSSEVSTVCVGMGMSAAAMILCGGALRQAAGYPERQDHDPPGDGRDQGRPPGHGDPPARGAGHDQADGARSSPITPGGRSSRSSSDIDRDYFMTAEQAEDYGLIDEVITPRRGISAELLAAADRAAEEVAAAAV